MDWTIKNLSRWGWIGIVLLLVFVGEGLAAEQKWRESKGLVAVWPQIQKEGIESITICVITGDELDSLKNEYKELPYDSSFRWRNDKDIEKLPVKYTIPQDNLDACIQIIDKAAANPVYCQCGLDERMLIITPKGKYVVWIETDIKNAYQPKAYGEDWESNELARFLAKYCCPDCEYTYSFPAKKDVAAILLYPQKKSRPLALWGDKKLAEQLVFDPNIKEDPQRIKGIVDLYMLTRVLMFGTEVRKENGKSVWDKELKPEKLFERRQGLEKIMAIYETAIQEAKKKDRYYPNDGIPYNARIVFLTQSGDYWKYIIIDKEDVCDDYIQSKELKVYFDELGLTGMLK